MARKKKQESNSRSWWMIITILALVLERAYYYLPLIMNWILNNEIFIEGFGYGMVTIIAVIVLIVKLFDND